MRFTGTILLTIAAALAAAPAAAQDIFRCVDAEGRVTLQNTGGGRGCTPLNIQPVLSVAAPASATARQGRGGSAAEPRQANFPKVDGATQRSRDNDRRRILEDELKAEESHLTSLRGEYNSGSPARRADERDAIVYQQRVQRLQQEIHRGETNVASLKRELALLARQ